MGRPSPAVAKFLDSLEGADFAIFAGRPFHFYYEPWLVKALLLADLPSFLLAGVTAFLISPISQLFKVGSYPRSYVEATILLMFASVQWLIVGKTIEIAWNTAIRLE
jgi:hypothetical protein